MKRRKAKAMANAGRRRNRIGKKVHARRARMLAAGIAVIATAFVSRAAQLQLVQGGDWQQQVQSQTTETREVGCPAVRTVSQTVRQHGACARGT